MENIRIRFEDGNGNWWSTSYRDMDEFMFRLGEIYGSGGKVIKIEKLVPQEMEREEVYDLLGSKVIGLFKEVAGNE